MIRLYYTGASILGEKIPSPSTTSLGNYVSNVKVPNGREESLFPNLSQCNLEDPDPIIIGLGIKNEGENILNSLTLNLKIEEDEEIHNFKFGVLYLGQEGFMEKINSPKDIPYDTELTDFPLDQNIVLDFSENPINPNDYVGFWFQRSLKTNIQEIIKETENLILNIF